MKLKNLTVVFAPNLWLVDTAAVLKLDAASATAELRKVERVENALNTLCTLALGGRA